MPRHPNGRGRIYNDAEVSLAAYLDRSSTVRDWAKVRGGHVFNSHILGSAFVAGSPDITDSTLDCHSVAGDACLLRASLGQGVEVWDSARLTDVILTGDVKVYGDAQLVGPWSLATGYGARIPAGLWTRPPRVHKFLRFPVTEGVSGAWVGCRFHKYTDWLNRYPEIARRMRWNRKEIDELTVVLDSWLNNPI